MVLKKSTGISERTFYYLMESGKIPKPPRSKINNRPLWSPYWIKKAEEAILQ